MGGGGLRSGQQRGDPLLLVKVKKEAGSAGDAASVCSYVYGIWHARGDVAVAAERVAGGLAPQYGRSQVGARTQAGDGTYGLAARVGSVWTLIMVAEEPQVEVCT